MRAPYLYPKRNVPLSETAVRMERSSVCYYYWKKKKKKKLALPAVSYYLSQERHLIHVSIARKELNVAGVT